MAEPGPLREQEELKSGLSRKQEQEDVPFGKASARPVWGSLTCL